MRLIDDRRHAARRVYMEVAELTAADRNVAIDAACGDDPPLRREVEALLRADAEAGGFMADPSAAASGSLAPDWPEAADSGTAPGQASQVIGRYKLLQPIGEGGFGTVWMAEQKEPVTRRVALKIIKLGMDTKQVIARFEVERQALALMDHPNIARVFDAGATETGRPFFVMEYIKGLPLLEYCQTQKLGVRARLDLFRSVCHAIQHAHQKGVIHRDIKPSNVLVTMHDGVPVPKVIDFGIAKATNAEMTQRTMFTEHRQLIGTPAYMSPEQAEMSGLDIDTRSDIYSLGILLYELLTGTTPFDGKSLLEAGFTEMRRIIREDEPVKPSRRLTVGDVGTRPATDRPEEVRRIGAILQGDIDWIIMKCLEKDRRRRYQTASALAADVRRHLDDEPVLAGPPSATYRMKKFAKRHRTGVLVGSAIAAALVLGLAGATYGLLEANAQRQLATERADELQQVVSFQTRQLGAIEPEAVGARLRASILEAAPAEQRDQLRATLDGINFTNIGLESLQANLFDPTLDAIEREFDGQPLVRARLMQALAMTLAELGLVEPAVGIQEEAVTLFRRELGDEHPATLFSINSLGSRRLDRGDAAAAMDHFQQAWDGRRRALGEDHRDTLISFANIGATLLKQGRFDESERHLREEFDRRRAVLGEDDPDTLVSSNNLAGLLMAQGRIDEAEPLLRQTFERRRRVLGEFHPATLSVQDNLGSALANQGRTVEALQHLESALEGRRRVLGDDHPRTLVSSFNKAYVLLEQDDLATAESVLQRTLEGRRRVLGPDHPETISSVAMMGVLRWRQGEPSKAEPFFRAALESRRRVLGEDHPVTLRTLHAVGALLREQGMLEEAERYFQQALDGRRRVVGDDHPDTLTSLIRLGAILNEMQRFEDGEQLVREAVATASRVFGDDDWRVAAARSVLGDSLRGRARFDEAESLLLESYAALERSLPENRRVEEISDAAARLASLYEAWSKPEQAAEWRAREAGIAASPARPSE